MAEETKALTVEELLDEIVVRPEIDAASAFVDQRWEYPTEALAYVMLEREERARRDERERCARDLVEALNATQVIDDMRVFVTEALRRGKEPTRSQHKRFAIQRGEPMPDGPRPSEATCDGDDDRNEDHIAKSDDPDALDEDEDYRADANEAWWSLRTALDALDTVAEARRPTATPRRWERDYFKAAALADRLGETVELLESEGDTVRALVHPLPSRARNKAEPPPCRACSECEGHHHWLETAAYVCKHCEVISEECDDCDGTGSESGDVDGDDPCPRCDGYGVLPPEPRRERATPSDKERRIVDAAIRWRERERVGLTTASAREELANAIDATDSSRDTQADQHTDLTRAILESLTGSPTGHLPSSIPHIARQVREERDGLRDRERALPWKPGDERHGELWDAIHAFGKLVYANSPGERTHVPGRIPAVNRIEAALRALVSTDSSGSGSEGSNAQ